MRRAGRPCAAPAARQRDLDGGRVGTRPVRPSWASRTFAELCIRALDAHVNTIVSHDALQEAGA